MVLNIKKKRDMKKEAKVAYTYYLQKNTSFGEQILNDLPFNLLEKLN